MEEKDPFELWWEKNDLETSLGWAKALAREAWNTAIFYSTASERELKVFHRDGYFMGHQIPPLAEIVNARMKGRIR